jgi:hypothetical protein
MVNVMKTHLTIYFNSEGTSPSTVAKRLAGLGFEPLKGTTDFVRIWDKGSTVQSVVWRDFQDSIHGILRGCQVLFAYKTVPD